MLISSLLFITCATPKTGNRQSLDSLSARDLHAYGRSFLDSNQYLHLVSTAVHTGFSFNGENCAINVALPAKGTHNYLQYELDGVYQKRIRVNGDSTIVINATRNGMHNLWLYKATEANTGDIIIKNISGTGILAIQQPGLPLIEFIGNSITCGAAADPSEVPCLQGSYHDQHNAYYAYGPRLARALKTEFMVSSVSGIGIYRTWNKEEPGMDEVYEATSLARNSTRRWNFKLFPPKIISIALGTNDLSNGDGTTRAVFDSTTFVTRYVQFIAKLKSLHPDARLALLNSPMLNGSRREQLQNCLTTIKREVDSLFPSAKPVALFFFQPMQARGCTGHPSVEDHAILAEQLIPFFQKLL